MAASKILIVAYSDDCMEAAYSVITHMKLYGYSSDICHINDEDSRIKCDTVLDGDTGLAGYEAVVFLDDGGDKEFAESVAKKAVEKDLVIGGHGEGLRPVASTGIFEDHYICQGLSDKQYEGATKVDAPSVRCDKLVTSIEGCAVGFAVLLVDALGGKVKNIVHANRHVPCVSSLVIAPIASWPSYWRLAKQVMQQSGNSLVLSDWDDVDVRNGTLRQCVLFDVASNDIAILSNQSIPDNIWFREADLTKDAMADAIAGLEVSGYRNVNSSEAIRKLEGQHSSLMVLGISQQDFWVFDGKSADVAAEFLTNKGVRSVRGTGDNASRFHVLGHGGKSAVSNGKSWSLSDAHILKRMLQSAFGQDPFIVKNASGNVCFGGERFRLKWTLARTMDGWKPYSRLAVSDNMTCQAQDVLRLVLPDEMSSIMEDADAMTQLVAMILQSLMSDPDGMSEVEMTVLLDDGTHPYVDEATAVTNPSLVRESMLGTMKLRKMAQAMGVDFEPVQDACDDSMADVFSRPRDPLYKRVLEREMANENIWMQPDGSFALRSYSGIKRVQNLDALIGHLKKEAIRAVNDEIESLRENGPTTAKMHRYLSCKSRHRLQLALELSKFVGDKTKTAGIYPSSVSGPYAHLELPMHERVFEWQEGDDWLVDRERAISDQRRYNPEYDKTNPYESAGFYMVWHEFNRDPTSWLNVLEGDTPYKTRNLLSPGKFY